MSDALHDRWSGLHRRLPEWGAYAALLFAAAVQLPAQPYKMRCVATDLGCFSRREAIASLSEQPVVSVWEVLPRAWKNPFDPADGRIALGELQLAASMQPPGMDASQTAAPPQSGSAPPAPPKKKRVYNSSATTGSPRHIFWIVPAFRVNYAGHFAPLTPKEKFQEWAQSAYDPEGLALGLAEAATLQYSATDGFCGYGTSFADYAKCYGAGQLDSDDSSFWGDFVFTVWWRQDPRYFRLGKGGFAKRTLYSISRVFVTYNDTGKNVFYSSALAGTGLAAVVSNFYYPKTDRGVSHTIGNIGIDLGNTALYNGSAEFWPDIDGWLHKKF